ncbi:TonB-dependent receptor [Winogradskyella sp. DF17]|uniref:TonB-dependent receptor n=1 Tax=Winogradskyella pelagia TaxID=2819984 RepID=A0ABS3SXR5_9FLAO|nr:outer membrane beta-barrel family protein [Winogradskyella sp. DF17]MBO3115278.1 TonB-dependent receptor [Winogradskyella sp. DF17]
MKVLIRIALCVLFFLTSFLVNAQELSITGKVVDANGNSIEFANVVLFESNSEIFLKGTSTDEKGIFSLENLSQNTYTLKISYIGFQSFEQIIVLNGNLDLKTIELEQGAESLDQVDIIATKPTITRKPDRLVFNIENTALTQGSTLGVLKNTPGVIVSEGGIAIKSAQAAVYINNKRVQLSTEELIQLLDSAPANSIKSVEVITNPPASYDADSGSVINIVMSRNLIAGYRGSVFSAFTQGVFPRYNFNTSHFFKNESINFNVNYNYNNQKINQINDEQIDYLDSSLQIDEVWTSNINRNTWSETHNLNLNFDYFITDSSTLSLTSTGLYMPYFKYRINNNTNINDASGLFQSRFTANNLSRDDKYNIGTDLSYTSTFENGSDLLINAHYTTYNYQRDQDVLSNFFDGNNSFVNSSIFNTLANQETDIFTAKLDYNLPLSETSSMATGLKFANVLTDSDITKTDFINGQPVIDINNSDAFKYDEKVFAAYVDYSQSWEKWDLNIGLRVEQTNIEGESVSLSQTNTQDYFNWFPTVSLSHQISDEVRIYGNYKRSIERPNFRNLNPFTFFINQNNVAVGNPNLRPTYIDHITLGTNFLEYFTVEAYYMTYDGNILELPLQNNTTNVLAYTPANLDNMVDFGFDFIVDYMITSRWYFYGVTSFYNITQEDVLPQGPVSLDRWSNLTILQNNLRLLKDNSLLVGFNLTYTNTYLQNLALIDTRWITGLTISKSIFNKKGTISLAVEDLFNEQDFLQRNRYLDQSSTVFSDYDNRFIKVGFRYNFGNTKLSTNERGSSAEERDRIKDLN